MEQASEVMERGLVEKLNEAKGYGFLSRADGSNIFFHMSALQPKSLFDSLIVGQQVQFSVGQTSRGLHAENVVIL